MVAWIVPVFSDNVLQHLAGVFGEIEAPPTRRAGRSDDFEAKTEVGVALEMPPIGGRFKVVAPLGSGGMGTVYRAIDLETGREVAVKVPHLLSSFVDKRFELEVDAIATVICPATIGFVARGNADEPFVAMELVRGVSLGKRLGERGAMPPSTAFAIARRLAAALAAVHLSGWVHRDVKPGNVVLTEDGTVRLVDFGLARSVDGPGAGTETGQILGTLGYLAPEQFGAARVVDPRTDIFALGCVLFECLTGRNAWSRGISDVISGRWTPEKHPRLDVRGAGIAPDLAAPVERLVENDPALRPEDGLAALEVLLSLEPRTRSLFTRTAPMRGAIRNVVRSAMRGPVAITGAAGSGKSSVALAAATLLSEVLAPAAVFVVRCNPRASRAPGGHSLLLERALRTASFGSAARVLGGLGLNVGSAAQEPSLVLVFDDASFADEDSIRWARTLASIGLARVILTVRDGAEAPSDFMRVALEGGETASVAELDELPAAHRRTLRLFAALGTSIDLHAATQLAVDLGVSMTPELLEDLVDRGILHRVGRSGMGFARASHWEHLMRTMSAEELRQTIRRIDELEASSGRLPLEVSFTGRASATIE